MSIDELARSLNGFDELAISKAFGYEVEEMMGLDKNDKSRKLKFLRALIFTAKRREGMKDGDAYRSTMEIPLMDLQEQFGELDDTDPSVPATK